MRIVPLLTTCAIVLTATLHGRPCVAQAVEGHDCGSIENAYGPYDYTNAAERVAKLKIVEEHHFDAGVEQLQGHLTKPGGPGMLGNDIDYTLRASPNHYRALWAMVRYNLEKTPLTAGKMRYTPECYFDRAMRFKPNDGVVRMLYGMYLHKISHDDEALQRYNEALSLAPDSAEVHYNLGLLLVDMQRFDEAVAHARRAYELGYPLLGLQHKLERAGRWPRDTVVAPPPS